CRGHPAGRHGRLPREDAERGRPGLSPTGRPGVVPGPGLADVTPVAPAGRGAARRCVARRVGPTHRRRGSVGTFDQASTVHGGNGTFTAELDPLWTVGDHPH